MSTVGNQLCANYELCAQEKQVYLFITIQYIEAVLADVCIFPQVCAQEELCGRCCGQPRSRGESEHSNTLIYTRFCFLQNSLGGNMFSPHMNQEGLSIVKAHCGNVEMWSQQTGKTLASSQIVSVSRLQLTSSSSFVQRLLLIRLTPIINDILKTRNIHLLHFCGSRLLHLLPLTLNTKWADKIFFVFLGVEFYWWLL